LLTEHLERVVRGRFPGVPIGLLSALLQVRDLRRLGVEILRQTEQVGFFNAVLGALDVRLDFSDAERRRIPASGALVVVANHPFGMVEGAALAALVRTVRTDVKVMANFMLAASPEVSRDMILVDPFGDRQALRANLRGVREAVHFLRGGGALIVFPAGEVSHWALPAARISDPEWRESVGRIIRSVRATVLPAYFSGRNGLLFQAVGVIHPALRTLMLPRELLNKRRRTLHVRIAQPVPFARLEGLTSDRAMIEHLRARTYLLAFCARTGAATAVAPAPTHRVAVAAPVSPMALRTEVAALPGSSRLAVREPLAVYLTTASTSPALLQEIGRLREVTFRAVGEGTGRAIDLDRFDGTYRHLFLWNEERSEVVGAYRIGLSDEILAESDSSGLYTSTLFEFGRRFFDRLGPALELGRSFIRPEYQRDPNGLLLLWKGIARFVAANPQYRTLFGPVSISGDYLPLARRLMVTYLSSRHADPELSREVRPRQPFRSAPWEGRLSRRLTGTLPDDEALSSAVAELQPDGRGIPVLLRQYLRLGGRILAFNVDPDFGSCVDGLIVVDLTATDPRVLARYMGAEDAARYRARHLGRESRTGRPGVPAVTPAL
jgi:putative hemolysin